MSYEVVLTERFAKEVEKHKKSGDKKLAQKIYSFLQELREHPRSGTGKPEQLKGFTTERWSRRIDQRHRLVYEIREDELIVLTISAYGHYE